MAELTLPQLLTLLRECAGVEDGIDLDGDILDVTFDELGYDSLAILQVAGRIEQELGVALPDETAAEAVTPRLLLAAVNQDLPISVG